MHDPLIAGHQKLKRDATHREHRVAILDGAGNQADQIQVSIVVSFLVQDGFEDGRKCLKQVVIESDSHSV
jgi:hypothetical protein